MLEALASLLAIAIVWSYVSPQSFRPRRDPRATAQSDVDAIGAALETYRYDTGDYPATAQGLAALVEVPASSRPWNWRGPYVRRRIPNDPWGNPYAYRCDAELGRDGCFALSHGADGRPGGQSDDADVTVHRHPMP